MGSRDVIKSIKEQQWNPVYYPILRNSSTPRMLPTTVPIIAVTQGKGDSPQSGSSQENSLPLAENLAIPPSDTAPYLQYSAYASTDIL